MIASARPSPTLSQRLFGIARLLILALVIARSIPVVLNLPGAYQKLVNLQPNTGLPGWTQAEMQAMTRALGISPQLLAGFLFAASLVCLLSFWIVAGLLFWKKGDSVVGLLSFFVLTGIGVGFSFLIPDTSRLTGWIGSLYSLQAGLVWATFFLLLYLFPDGGFVPRWTRLLAPLAFGLFFLGFWYGDTSPGWLTMLALAYIAGGLASQVYRYTRVATREQRQQTKWIVFALGILILNVLAGQLLPLIVGALNQKTPARFLFDVGYNYLLGALLAALLPVAIGFSIFRYRLYDIDLIIRKTVVYTIVTGLLALVYFGGTILLQGLFGRVTGGSSSPLVTVISTLAIAALFSPLRRRVQDFIDRRFYRQKYDAEQTLQAFAARARDEVELERLSAALVSAVEETVQPEEVSLWLTSVQR